MFGCMHLPCMSVMQKYQSQSIQPTELSLLIGGPRESRLCTSPKVEKPPPPRLSQNHQTLRAICRRDILTFFTDRTRFPLLSAPYGRIEGQGSMLVLHPSSLSPTHDPHPPSFFLGTSFLETCIGRPFLDLRVDHDSPVQWRVYG